MDPGSARFQRMFANPFAFVPFKATEPWLEEYMNLDLLHVLQNIGYRDVQRQSSTPGHFTLVGRKPTTHAT